MAVGDGVGEGSKLDHISADLKFISSQGLGADSKPRPCISSDAVTLRARPPRWGLPHRFKVELMARSTGEKSPSRAPLGAVLAAHMESSTHS